MPAARAPDGRLAVTYLPDHPQIALDVRGFAGR
jgi:hypothetical protein